MVQEIIKKNNFILKEVREIAEMQGRLWEMEHPKSGAKLVWLDRADENMTFSIGFRTIPTDSTGVFHILEHSVLGGSEKYPVKEPFVELLKSSLQTFLNAMTFPDKTVYPFSSRNQKDFMNLLGIYMDAVLHPLAMKSPDVFRQEGWRMELNEEGKPIFQGVVYNEMKGAFSDVRDVLEYAMNSRLFPDTCYGFEAGGDPAKIPDLTYEHYCAEHAKYYHPSNALIVLDGSIDADAVLSFLDGILSAYDRQDMVFPIAIQEPLPFREERVPYEIGADEDGKGKTIVSGGKLLCTYADAEKLYAANILADYLSDGSEGPLKKAVLDAGLGSDLHVRLHDGVQQAWFGWNVWNTEEEKIPAIRETIRNTVRKIADEGLDKERLLGCYNSLAFQLMDRDGKGYPRGLMEIITILEPWNYGGDPAQNLSYRKVLDSLKEKLDTDYFENLLRECLLDESTGVLLTLVPDKTLGSKRVEAEQARVAARYAALTDAEKASLPGELEVFHAWQQTPNTPEELATIPMLSREDIAGEPAPIVWEEVRCADVTVLKHKSSSDLTYTDLFFEASDLTPEQMPVLKLLTGLLGTLPTDKLDSAALQTQVRQKIGTLEITPEVFFKTVDTHRTVVAVRSVCLPAFREDAAQLIADILTATRFEDVNLLRDLLRQAKNSNQMRLVSGGNRYAIGRAAARQTSAGAAKEQLSGCDYIRWVIDHCEIPAEDMEDLMAQLKAMAEKLFVRERLTVSVSENAYPAAQALCAAFRSGTAAAEEASFPLLAPCREGILVPAGVGFAGKLANLQRFGAEFTGDLLVLSNLLSFQYLWKEIRVSGGAYGAGFAGMDNGDVASYSFRDPNPGRSVEIFDRMADFAEEFCTDDLDTTKFILGAMSDADPLLGASGKIYLAENRYFKGVDQADVCRIRQELVSATPQSLRALCAALRKTAEAENYTVVGGKQQLDAMADKLDRVWDIFA